MTDKDKLEMLIEAIDYSFLNTQGEYDKSLTYPVMDKVRFIKKTMQEESVSDDLQKEVEKTKAMVKYLELNTDDIVDFCVSHYTKWQQEQMMKEAVEVPVEEAVPFGSCKWKLCAKLWLDKGVKGNKVKLIILKDTTS